MGYYRWGDKNLFRTSLSTTDEEDSQSLVICLRFYEITDNYWSNAINWSHGITNELNDYNHATHNRFKKMDIFDLFKLKISKMIDAVGDKGNAVGNVYNYYLNFGRDVDGAAAIITQYMIQNFNILDIHSAKLDFELLSITEEEYSSTVAKERNKKNARTIAVFIFCIIGIIVGLFLLISYEYNSPLEGVLCIVGSLWLLIRAIIRRKKE